MRVVLRLFIWYVAKLVDKLNAASLFEIISQHKRVSAVDKVTSQETTKAIQLFPNQTPPTGCNNLSLYCFSLLLFPTTTVCNYNADTTKQSDVEVFRIHLHSSCDCEHIGASIPYHFTPSFSNNLSNHILSVKLF